MKFLIYGVGAIGSYFGVRIAQAGHEVFFISREYARSQLLEHGIKVTSQHGDYCLKTQNIYNNPKDAPTPDVVLITTKAHHVPEIIDQLKLLLSNSNVLIPLQNGIETVEVLGEKLGSENVIPGFCYIAAEMVSPVEVKHSFARAELVLDKKQLFKSPKCFEALSKAKGMTVIDHENFDLARWEKFASLASISAVGALTRQVLGVNRTVPETRELLAELVHEIVAIARKIGVNFPVDIVDSIMAKRDTFNKDLTTSLQRDIISGKPSELEWQLGSVVRLAKRYGLNLPISKALYACLLPLELAAQKRIPG
jgi:2-dehydropantoate 2-reductase